MSTTKTIISYKPKTNKKTTTVSKVVTKPKHKTKNNKNKQRRRKSPNLAQKWCAVLNDPFLHGPINLGMGTMVPTQLGTAFYRNTLTANADGTFAIYCIPSVSTAPGSYSYSIYYNNSGTLGTTWQSQTFQNTIVFNNLAYEGRVIGYGIRAIPLVASTAVPGISYSGACPSTTVTYMNSCSPTVLIQQDYLQPAIGNLGIVATGRPVDNDAFALYASTIQGFSPTTIPSWSIPTVLFTGLPGSTSINLEIVLHIEYIAGAAQSSTWSQQDQSYLNSSTSSSNSYYTMENLYNTVRTSLLPSSFITNTLTSLEDASQRVIANSVRTLGNAAMNHIRNRRHQEDYFMIEDVD